MHIVHIDSTIEVRAHLVELVVDLSAILHAVGEFGHAGLQRVHVVFQERRAVVCKERWHCGFLGE